MFFLILNAPRNVLRKSYYSSCSAHFKVIVKDDGLPSIPENHANFVILTIHAICYCIFGFCTKI